VDDAGANLGANLRRLREARGLSQQQMAQLASIPRPTWASLEAGSANPTLGVLTRVAAALQVSIEELIGPPRTAAELFPAAKRPERRRGDARIRPLLPEPIPGLDITRRELAPGGTLAGIPHTPGTREYLTCEAGTLELAASGELWKLERGDALVFRGDIFGRSMPARDLQLLSVMQTCMEQLGPTSAADGLFDRICAAIRMRLPGGYPTLEQVAHDLRISPGAVQRELSEHNVTYKDAVETTRRNLAEMYLQQRQLPLTEIALLLG